MQNLSSFLKCNTSITKYIHYIQGIKKLLRLLVFLILCMVLQIGHTYTHRRCHGCSHESPNLSTCRNVPTTLNTLLDFQTEVDAISKADF